jgi:hypothetical protein
MGKKHRIAASIDMQYGVFPVLRKSLHSFPSAVFGVQKIWGHVGAADGR